MSDAVLNIKIGADVSGASAGLKQASADAAKFGASVETSSKSVAELALDVKRLTGEINNLSAAERAGQPGAVLAEELKAAKTELDAATSSVKLLVTAEGELQSASTGASFGITKSRVAFQDLGRIISGQGFSLRSISSNFILFGPAVTIAAAALGYIIEKFFLAADANEKLNKTLGEGTASMQGQIAELKDYGAIALDNTNTTQERAKAFKILQDQYPGYLGNLSIEKSSYEEISKALDLVSSALVRQAQIKGLEGAITDVYKELNKTIAEGGTTFEKATAYVSAFVDGLGKGALSGKAFAGSIAHSLDVDTQDASKQVDILNTKLQELLKTSLGDKLDVKAPKADKKIQDDNLAYLEKVKTLTESLSKEDKNPLFKDFAESAEGALGALNLDIYKEHLKKATEDAAKGSIRPDTFSKYADALHDALVKQQNPDLKIKIPFELQAEEKFEDSDQIDKAVSKIAHDIKPVHLHLVINGFDQLEAAEIEKTAKKIGDSFNKTLNTALQSGIEAIAGAVGKGSVKGLFSSIETIIGDGLESLGKSLLEAFPIINLAKTAIENAIYDPELIAVAGALAIGAGAVIKGLASNKGIHAFAEGGIVTGPTVGLVGEAGPEAIFPLSKLDQFIKNTQGNGGSVVTVRGQLSGNVLNLVAARANKNQGFV